MLSAISAEMQKLTRHRATWGLVWIYPIGLIVIFLILAFVTLVGGGDGGAAEAPRTAEWINDAAGFWEAPRNTIVRILVAGFTALAFAGEYGWNTWKLVVPHRARWQLIAAKYVVVTLLLFLSFVIAAWLFTGMQWAEDMMSGDPVPAGITAGALINAHWEGLLAAIGPVLVTIGYASLASIITRSTLGALIVAIVVITVEQTIFGFGPILNVWVPGLIWALYHLLPGYHLSNLTNWVGGGDGLTVPFPPSDMVALSPALSLAVVAGWIVLLAGLTFWRFGRQDIN